MVINQCWKVQSDKPGQLHVMSLITSSITMNVNPFLCVAAGRLVLHVTGFCTTCFVAYLACSANRMHGGYCLGHYCVGVC